MSTPDEVEIWIGLDVGKEDHFADVLDDDGESLFARSVANNEADLVADIVVVVVGAEVVEVPPVDVVTSEVVVVVEVVEEVGGAVVEVVLVLVVVVVLGSTNLTSGNTPDVGTPTLSGVCGRRSWM